MILVTRAVSSTAGTNLVRPQELSSTAGRPPVVPVPVHQDQQLSMTRNFLKELIIRIVCKPGLIQVQYTETDSSPLFMLQKLGTTFSSHRQLSCDCRYPYSGFPTQYVREGNNRGGRHEGNLRGFFGRQFNQPALLKSS